MELVSIVVVANVRLYREGLAAELRGQSGFRVVGLAADLPSAAAAVRAAQPDVVLLDSGTPRTPDVVHAVKRACTHARVVAFAVDENERAIEECAAAGVAAFVTRDVTVDGLTAAIYAAVNDELTCSPRTAALLFKRLAALSTVRAAMDDEQSTWSRLTGREREIVGLLADGRSNKEIGSSLNIEVATVKNHVHSILEKLNVASRAEAAAVARRAD